jgi:hypothetical protein
MLGNDKKLTGKGCPLRLGFCRESNPEALQSLNSFGLRLSGNLLSCPWTNSQSWVTVQ